MPRPIPEPLLEPLARRLQVLGQPVRIRLIDRLELEGALSVGELAARVEITSYHASQQLGVLRETGVVSRRQRGREGVYSLGDERVLHVYELVVEQLANEQHAIRRRLGAEE